MYDPGFRQFWLENETGERIGLNGEHEWFLLNPTGLGYTNGINYASLKNGFFTAVSDNTPEQQSVVGDLVFHGDDPYTQYRFFADWVLKSKELYLLYMPRTTVYRRRISLGYLTKTEISRQGVLVVPIAMKGLTPWYLPSISDGIDPIASINYDLIMDQSQLDAGARSSDTDPYPAIFGNEEYPRYRHFRIMPHGQAPASFTIVMNSPLVNPKIVVATIDGKLIGECQVLTSFQDLPSENKEILKYSSAQGNSYIRKTATDSKSETDLIDSVADLTSNIYPKLDPGVWYDILLTADNGISGKVVITVQDYLNGV